MRVRGIQVFLVLIALLALSSLACGLSILERDSSSGTDVAVVTVEALTEVDVVEQLEGVVVQDSVAAVQVEPPVVGQTPAGLGMLDLEARLIELYDQVNPSVVHILVYRDAGDALPLGSGSGFLYDAAGHIVTNNHVVQDGNVFEVVFYDGDRRRAEVVGSDVDSDLAVLLLESVPTGITPLPLGSSDEVQVGEFVIAIGNPFGEQGSMSLGIVSGLGRSLESQRILENSVGSYSLPGVVQTDAPINPGNSGGPLLDLEGRVVGINSAIRSTTGVNSGVGFSIPVDAVARIVPDLIEDGRYTYSFLGVTIQSLNLNLQERFDLPQVTGAYLTSVTPGGPADAAGLIPADSSGRGGDLIVAIEGTPVIDTQSLIGYLVFKTEVGQTVDLTVIRDGETITLPTTLGARP